MCVPWVSFSSLLDVIIWKEDIAATAWAAMPNIRTENTA